MANYIVQKESLESVADSIRAKAGISEKLEFPLGWKAAVDGIQTGGGTAGGGDGSPFMVEKVVNIGAAVSVTAEDYGESGTGGGGASENYTHALYNGVKMPKLPENVLVSHPYAWMRTNGANYDLFLAVEPWVYSGTMKSGNTVQWYIVAQSEAATAMEWTFNKTLDSGSVGVNTVVWSSHDIPNGSTTNIYFAGSEPVPTE